MVHSLSQKIGSCPIDTLEDSQVVDNLGDRYHDGGRDMTQQSTLAAVQVQMELTRHQAEEVCEAFPP